MGVDRAGKLGMGSDLFSSDTRFFTNRDDDIFLARLGEVLGISSSFDVLVGYFYGSGFLPLSEYLDSSHVVRILVGLNVDRVAFDLLDRGKVLLRSDDHREAYRLSVIDDMQKYSDDTDDVLRGARRFVDLVRLGNLEVRVHPERNIHAKLYIATFADQIDDGRVFTGSSNLTRSGLLDRHEFNVELKDSGDYRFALGRFEELWSEGIEISRDDIISAYDSTWINPAISVYDGYLKFLQEYFSDYFVASEKFRVGDMSDLPIGYSRLSYQVQAVSQARRILEQHNGVFLSDVVGLGKTYIAALLLRSLDFGRKLVICSPSLCEYWESVLDQFGVMKYRVCSWGILDRLVSEMESGDGRDGRYDYEYVVVDESHTFRNENSRRYGLLHRLCYGRRVVLVTATPFNNDIGDILSQLKLFQGSRLSSIPNLSNLHDFFGGHRRLIRGADSDSGRRSAVRRASYEIRNKILSHVMVRRTRSDVIEYFGADLVREGVKFPDVSEPELLSYNFGLDGVSAFDRTLDLMRDLEYVRYGVLLYLRDPLSAFERQQYVNLSGFMRCILVKRLESSIYAFRRTLDRFILSHEQFLAMYRGGDVYISRRVDVYDYMSFADSLDGGVLGSTGVDRESLSELVLLGKVHHYGSDLFTSDYEVKLERDLETLRSIRELWSGVDIDPKFASLERALSEHVALRSGKLLIFSEARETVEYLHDRLHALYPGEVMAYFSGGGYLDGKRVGKRVLSSALSSNFDPNVAESSRRNDVRILLATDILSEGMNLHRGNVVINYDLPWNPTRVLQRAGRINRVGTEHGVIHIFNIFPSAGGEEALGLRASILSKIAAFHEALGEDAKYLSDDERPVSHGLFAESVLSGVMERSVYEGDIEGDDEVDAGYRSELSYFREILEIKENDPVLFKRIESLPSRLRIYRAGVVDGLPVPYLLSFFKRGLVRKFVGVGVGSGGTLESRELLFPEAASMLSADKGESSLSIGSAGVVGVDDYLGVGKDYFASLLSSAGDVVFPPRSVELYILGYLKSLLSESSLMLRDVGGITNEDFVHGSIDLLRRGLLSGMICDDVHKELKRLESYALEEDVMMIFRKYLTSYVRKFKAIDGGEEKPSQVILSNFFIEG